ncbi:aspartyl-tRNA(Asn)/glutamyl-tRNA(Gln) amidotransferase subunit C [Peptoniphilus koenoeneniae]|uniref:Aspartyl-tRNA(Asn)/glutamyl-tRNA(Gln) amidotransferase subunit C n=1 Tax=Peptoniphilus koenoeneniae TaxID=507751 RepID=A0ABU0AUB7_9FIRM|nr:MULTISPECIES: Asp-tRNA(Asn)/Glu-tRNA(Gln) amidotransferase subunit GatC [Peptoniphilus]ERT60168.1 aspartyl/glutamyl-tRNA(Asn/Gln) amidotransferase, C subunit [Peptoniphilus sp. BV3C26]MDQ0274402.1 aspartyl-tRNA(Asn)/glutamyl-tRNA(Gln) amidotransferase subunit C [Peptoniphilus koenoeneniae]
MKLEEIKHIADIAQIEFSEEELKNFEEDFSETMNLIDSIAKIDTENIEGVFQVNGTINNLREDKVKESLDVKDATENTAEEKYGFFKIIKFVE